MAHNKSSLRAAARRQHKKKDPRSGFSAGASRHTRQKLDLALNAARTGTWHLEINTDIRTCDANLNGLLGLPHKATASPRNDFIERIHPDDRERFLKSIEGALNSRSGYEIDFRIVRPDGTQGWLRDRGSVFCNDGGDPEAMAGACVDITDQKRAEVQQHAYLDRISLLIYASYEVINKSSLPEVLQCLADEARALTGSRIAAAGHGYENDDFQLTTVSAPEKSSLKQLGDMFPAGSRSMYRDIIRYSKPVRLSESEMREHPSSQAPGGAHPLMRGLLGVPLLEQRGLASGMVVVGGKKRGSFTPEDEMLLSQFALFASLAIQHIEARLELQHMHTHLEKRVQQRTEALMSANLALEQEIINHKQSASRLRESEERYRSVIESMAEGMLLLDEDGVIIDCNKNAEYIFGRAQDSLMGTAFISLEHLFVREDEEAPFSPAALSIMITQRSAQPVHNVVLGVDNPRRGVVWISLNAQPVFGRSGQRSQGTVVTFNDISSRKHLEDELRLTTEQYRAVVEDQTELICRFRTTGEITFVNEAYCRYFAKRQNDLIGSRFLPFISKKDKQSLWPRIEALSADSRSCLIEQRLKLPGGSTRWTQWSITALISNGTVYEYQGVGRDIHEIKELQDTVKQNQYVLQSVVNGISDPLYMVDRKYRVKMANQATMDYYGVTADRVIGQQCYRVFMDAGTPCADCVIFRQNSRLQPKTFERSGRLDQHTYEQVTIYPLSQKKADLMSAIIHIKDITKTKMLEKRIGQSERLASLGLLISGITHEINNPNNFITFNIPVLRDYISTLMPIADDYASRHENFTVYNMPYNEFRQDLYRLIDNMEHGSERITRTVSSLREFIRNEGSGAISKVQIKEVIDKAITLCGTKIKKAARSFSVDIAPDIGIIHTDPQALEHVIIILLVNAAEASDKQDSSVRITGRAGSTWQERVIIDVVDNGCGIEKEHIEKVFEPFFTTKTESGGTGLGMYICRDIIKGIGGAVTIESTPGEGTTVRLVIPDIHEE